MPEKKSSVPVWMSGVTLGVGAALLAVSIYLFKEKALLTADVRLLFCGGLGLIFAALGTRVSGKWLSWSVSGSGGVAIVLFLILTKVAPPPEPPAVQVVEGLIQGEFKEKTNIVVRAESALFHRWDVVNKTYRFKISKEDVKQIGCLTVELDPLEGSATTTEAPVIQVHYRHVLEYFDNEGNGKEFDWWYDPDDPKAIYHASNKDEPIGQVFCGGPTGFHAVPETTRFSIRQGNIGPWKFAGLVPGAKAANRTYPIEFWIKGLASDDVVLRRGSRSALGNFGTAAVPPLMKVFRERKSAYRIALGTTVALWNMLNEGRSSAKELQGLLSDKDVAALTRLVGHRDKTMRIHATNLAVALLDPRAVSTVLDVLKSSRNDNGKYNAALTLEALFGRLDKQAQASTSQRLKAIYPALGSKTQKILMPFVKEISRATQGSEGWVYVGSHFGKTWKEKFFDVRGKPDSEQPKTGDILVANASVNIRKQPIRYVKGEGWVNADVTGQLKAGDAVDTLEVRNIASGFYWVRFRRK